MSAHLADVPAAYRGEAATAMEKQLTTATQPARSERVEQIVDLALRLCVGPGSASPHGHTRDRSGREQRFHGWLGLLGVLERLCAPTSDASPRHSQPTRNARRQDMSSTRLADPMALQTGEGEALWFLGALATVKASSDATGGRVTILELLAPRGHGSPLHVRRDHDQWFYVLNGELTFWIDGEVIAAPAGSFVLSPRGIPFTFAVSSEQARFILVIEPGTFEAFMRTLAEPAQRLEIPAAPTDPPDFERLAAIAAQYGIEILGPPGIPA